MGLDENVTPTPIMTPYEDNGEIVMHDLQKGNYSVTISVGPLLPDNDRSALLKAIWQQLSDLEPDFR